METDRWTDGQMDRWTSNVECIACPRRWRWRDGEMDRWTDGQMDRWTDGHPMLNALLALELKSGELKNS